MKKEMTYEEAISKLQNIVEELENGNVPLQKSLELFEEGAKLTSFCMKTLDAAELKIRSVTDLQNEVENHEE